VGTIYKNGKPVSEELKKREDGTYKRDRDTTVYIDSKGQILPKVFESYGLTMVQKELSMYRYRYNARPKKYPYYRQFIEWLEQREKELKLTKLIEGDPYIQVF
jgi:hypothetical protein